MCTDSEKSLNDSIISAINQPGGNFKYSKFRLDYYHLVTQPINKFVGLLPRKSEAFYDKVKIIRNWIRSWFAYVLTKEEFSVSYNRLENFLINNGHVLDDLFVSSIKGLLKSLMCHIEVFANHFFHETVTLGFIGSSIVEGMNQCLKYGDYACKPTMTIDKSSENQIRLAENQARQRKVGEAKCMKQYISDNGPIIRHSTCFLKYMPGNTSINVPLTTNVNVFTVPITVVFFYAREVVREKSAINQMQCNFLTRMN